MNADPFGEGASCHFCGRPGLSWFVHSDAPINADDIVTDDTPDAKAATDAFNHYRGVVTLCARHEGILRRAGAAGRRHGPTGTRWWLGV